MKSSIDYLYFQWKHGSSIFDDQLYQPWLRMRMHTLTVELTLHSAVEGVDFLVSVAIVAATLGQGDVLTQTGLSVVVPQVLLIAIAARVTFHWLGWAQ